MNAAHVHLLFNHLPIIGSVIGGLILIYAVFAKSERTIIAAYAVLALSAVGGVITYFTGEGAEEIVENISGISKGAIEQHESFAFFAFIGITLVGLASLVGLFLQYKKSSFASTVAWVTFFASIVAFSLLAGAGYTGGQIRHTELTQTGAGNIQEADEDD
jgi:hypothetical protein